MPDIFKDHFSAVAGNYAAFRPKYPRALFAWLASITSPAEVAWDCAAGNGQAAVGLVEFFPQVIATDASLEQISSATPHARVRYGVAPAESSGLADASVNLVTVAQAAHWFDLPRFYGEVRRVLRPGGTVALWCYGHIQFRDCGIQELVARFYSETVGPYWPPERHFIEEEYRTLPFPFREIETPTFAMEADFTLERFFGYLRTWSATQRYMRARGADPVRALEQEFRRQGKSLNPGDLTWPIHMRAARI